MEQLNLKPKNFKDLINDEPFKREDIIILQDPSDLEKFNFATFHHMKNNLKIDDDEVLKAKKDPKYYLKGVSAETKDILEELEKEYKPVDCKEQTSTKVADRFNSVKCILH